MPAYPWGGQTNGLILPAELTQLRGEPGDLMRSDAARQFDALATEFRKHFGKGLVVLEAYRSLAEQRRLRVKFLYEGGNPAALPGTSIHGWGLAVDLASGVDRFGSAEHNWMLSVAPRYGFDNTRGRWDGEAWHWEHGNITPITTVASSTGTPFDNKEDDMTPEQSAQLAAVATQVEALSAAVFTGGTSMEDGQRSISRSLASIQKDVGRSVWGYLTASVGRNGNRVSFAQMIRDLEVVVRRIDAKQPQAAPAQQWSADEFTAIIKAELAADSFDDAAADRIAAKVAALVTFPTVEETAEATADEIDERERERLGLGA